jgi:hypothetical protein
MFNNFDPYDTIIAMDIKLSQLVDAHNQLALDYEQHKHEFKVLLDSHQLLQKSILHLTHNNVELGKVCAHLIEVTNNK